MAKNRNKNRNRSKEDPKERNSFEDTSTGDATNATAKRDHKDRKPSSKEKKDWSMNDANWYMPNEAIKQNFNYALEGMLGVPANLSDVEDVAETIPTIMSIGFFQTPGDTTRDILGFTNPSSAAINVAARVFYTELSSENKKTTGYQPQDIALAIIAESQLISAMAMATRLYAVALQYNIKNRDIPYALIEAMGIDPTTFVANSAGTGMSLSDFRDFYNLLAQQANSLPFVGGIKEFEKSWAMFANYYTDNPIAMGQLYVPNMDYIGVYDETPDPSDPATLIKTVKYESFCDANNPISVTTFLNKIKKMLDALNTSSLMNYVYPDILNFMQMKGAGNFRFPILSDMYILPPVYNELWLTQIHNLTIPANITPSPITQDPTRNIIETHIQFDSPNKACHMAQYVDFPFTENPSVDEKIDALMFKVGVRDTRTVFPITGISYVACPDFIGCGITIFGNRTKLFHLGENFLYNGANMELVNSLFAKFKAAPILYVFDVNTGDFVHTCGSLDTFSIIRYADLKPVFDQALMGLFTYDASRLLVSNSK